MPLPASETMVKFVRRHAHDVRNHCSGIDLDASLLAELSDDAEITAMAGRLKKQVARIELDLKLLLLKIEEPRPVTITTADLVQLWRMKLEPVSVGAGSILWPEASAGIPITLDTKLTVQALCELAVRSWDRHPVAALEVAMRIKPEQVMLDLIQPPDGLQPAADFIEEMAAVLAVGGLQLSTARDELGERWVTTLVIPVSNPS